MVRVLRNFLEDICGVERVCLLSAELLRVVLTLLVRCIDGSRSQKVDGYNRSASTSRFSDLD